MSSKRNKENRDNKRNSENIGLAFPRLGRLLYEIAIDNQQIDTSGKNLHKPKIKIPGKNKKDKVYTIVIIGDIPVDLPSRISEIHGKALVQTNSMNSDDKGLIRRNSK
ncbi:hypothetical protein ACFLUG_02700 [Chloroflexota bacterium]